MGAEEHRRAASREPATFHVVTVSTSRTQSTDESGPLIAERVLAAGHRLNGKDLVPDEQPRIAALLRALQAAGGVDVVVLSGGTGLSARDRTTEAVREVIEKELPGFGELFRHLSFQEIGAAAMASRALCGAAGRMLIFALPGSPAACRLALDALILAEVQHLLHDLRREAPTALAGTAGPTGDEPPSPAGGSPLALSVDLRETAAEVAPPAPGPVQEGAQAGWQGALAALGAVWSPGPGAELPAALAGNAPLGNVLDVAPQRGRAVIGERTWGLYGYPDLVRPASKVLAVGHGDPWGVVIALHRHPRRAGILTRVAEALPGWPSVDSEVGALGRAITGQPCPGQGQPFAVDGGRLYICARDRVQSWDGRRLRDEGTPRAVLASLALQWSTR
jgi:molybdenum cofactor biosynthesis protein B